VSNLSGGERGKKLSILDFERRKEYQSQIRRNLSFASQDKELPQVPRGKLIKLKGVLPKGGEEMMNYSNIRFAEQLRNYQRNQNKSLSYSKHPY